MTDRDGPPGGDDRGPRLPTPNLDQVVAGRSIDQITRKGRGDAGGHHQVPDPQEADVSEGGHVDDRGVVVQGQRGPNPDEVPVASELYRVVAEWVVQPEQGASLHRERRPVGLELHEQVALLERRGGWRPGQISLLRGAQERHERRGLDEGGRLDAREGERLRNQVRVLAGLQVEPDRVAWRRVLGPEGTQPQLEREHRDQGRRCPAPPVDLVPPQAPGRGGEADEQHREAAGVREGEQGHAEPEEGSRAQPPREGARGERLIPKTLETDGAQHRDGDDRQIAHASGVVQVHVAERDAQEQLAHPGGRDDRVEHQYPRQHERASEGPHEDAPSTGSQRERHADQDGCAGIGSGRGPEGERPGRPHPVGLERAHSIASERADRVAQTVVASGEARRLQRVEARDEDRERQQGQCDEERRRPCGGGRGTCTMFPSHRSRLRRRGRRPAALCRPRVHGSGARSRPATTRGPRRRSTRSAGPTFRSVGIRPPRGAPRWSTPSTPRRASRSRSPRWT